MQVSWLSLILFCPPNDSEWDDLRHLAAAVENQVNCEVNRAWGLSAKVTPIRDVDAIPDASWPILIIKNDKRIWGSSGSQHVLNSQRPFALVEGRNAWSETTQLVSHEAIEMLANPDGNQLTYGPSPEIAQGRVGYLKELCDPCQQSGYSDNTGVTLSDFCLRPFFYERGICPLSYRQTLGGNQDKFEPRTPFVPATDGTTSWLYGNKVWLRKGGDWKSFTIDPPCTNIKDCVDNLRRLGRLRAALKGKDGTLLVQQLRSYGTGRYSAGAKGSSETLNLLQAADALLDGTVEALGLE